MYLRSTYSGVLTALALGVALSGCSGDYDTNSWFAKPANLFGRNLGYSYSQLGETKEDRRITADDLVDANGAWPRFAPTRQMQPAPGAPDAAAADAATLFSGSVGIGMSECEVVSRVGAPNAVNLSRNQNGDRTAVLTFQGGPRPGVYRFVAGRLAEMDRVNEPAPPEPAKKPPVKKKSEKAKKPPKKEDNS